MSSKIVIEMPKLGADVPRWKKGDEHGLFPVRVGRFVITFADGVKEVLIERIEYRDSSALIKKLFPEFQKSVRQDVPDKAISFNCYEHITKGVCFIGATLMEFWQVLREHIVSVEFVFEMNVLPGMKVRQGNELIGNQNAQIFVGCELKGQKAVITCRSHGPFDALEQCENHANNNLYRIWGWGMVKVNIGEGKDWDDHVGVVSGFQARTLTQGWLYEPNRD
jgi:hypothetical protein